MRDGERKKIPGHLKRKETFLSARFKWKLSQVKHKVNQMNLMPRAFQSAALTRLTRLQTRGPEAAERVNAFNGSK